MKDLLQTASIYDAAQALTIWTLTNDYVELSKSDEPEDKELCTAIEVALMYYMPIHEANNFINEVRNEKTNN